FAYEVDGLGAVLAADDANLPSLLGLPLTSAVTMDDPRYLATRARILSSANPWWHRGKAAIGIGSPHTPGNRVWPIALAVEGLTSPDRDERLRLARLLADTTAGTGRMHESFDADDPSDFTRGWFSWADMMFCELLASLT
ncbi:MAG: glycoside hydrolase family 125 protein, partial [Luteococcus japonicus]